MRATDMNTTADATSRRRPARLRMAAEAVACATALELSVVGGLLLVNDAPAGLVLCLVVGLVVLATALVAWFHPVGGGVILCLFGLLVMFFVLSLVALAPDPVLAAAAIVLTAGVPASGAMFIAAGGKRAAPPRPVERPAVLPVRAVVTAAPADRLSRRTIALIVVVAVALEAAWFAATGHLAPVPGLPYSP